MAHQSRSLICGNTLAFSCTPSAFGVLNFAVKWVFDLFVFFFSASLIMREQDSPVATGFSYVEDENLVVKTDEEAATDLTTLLKALFNGNETLQKSPLFIVAESYGGKFAVTLGVSALRAIEAGELKLQLGGNRPVSGCFLFIYMIQTRRNTVDPLCRFSSVSWFQETEKNRHRERKKYQKVQLYFA